MKLNILSEGVVWKNPHPSIRSRVALKGYNLPLGGGEILYSMQVGQARQSADSRCVMLRSPDYGQTWQQAPDVIPEEQINPKYGYGKANLSLGRGGTIWASSMRFEQVDPEHPKWTKQNSGWLNSENFICHSLD